MNNPKAFKPGIEAFMGLSVMPGLFGILGTSYGIDSLKKFRIEADARYAAAVLAADPNLCTPDGKENVSLIAIDRNNDLNRYYKISVPAGAPNNRYRLSKQTTLVGQCAIEEINGYRIIHVNVTDTERVTQHIPILSKTSNSGEKISTQFCMDCVAEVLSPLDQQPPKAIVRTRLLANTAG